MCKWSQATKLCGASGAVPSAEMQLIMDFEGLLCYSWDIREFQPSVVDHVLADPSIQDR